MCATNPCLWLPIQRKVPFATFAPVVAPYCSHSRPVLARWSSHRGHLRRTYMKRRQRQRSPPTPQRQALRSPRCISSTVLDRHSFDTLAILGEQVVPGSRDAKVPEFLDLLLEVESIETQKRFTQSLGAFEREAREAHGKPWKALTAEQATALLTRISGQPDSDMSRHAFDSIKGAVAETYYSTEVGMKELGWNGSIAFAPPGVCG